MKLSPAATLSAARRQHFRLFLIKVFETLHPGDPQLELSWYLRAICHALAEVHAGNERRLVVTVPPRHLKSVAASVAFVAWVWATTQDQDHGRELQPGPRQAPLQPDTHDYGSEWYKKDFLARAISDRGNRALELETTTGGVRKAVSVGGSITGFGADIIIVDDCMKADEAKSPTVRQSSAIGSTIRF
jgi:hypothetical protein